MIVTYDTEFWDNGRTTELISIGMVAEDGRTLYFVNGEAPWHEISKQSWIMEHVVVPHLPMRQSKEWRWTPGRTWFPDLDHPTVKPSKDSIAVEVEQFLNVTREDDEGRDPELWAYYSATDHVVGYQLFGSMIEASRDHGWPMRTSCLKQEEVQLERRMRQQLSPGPIFPNALGDGPTFATVWADFQERRPVQRSETEHHALADAKHDMALAVWLGLAQRPGIKVDADPADIR
jgi:hypothetical protein